jgi:hypothetical protein
MTEREAKSKNVIQGPWPETGRRKVKLPDENYLKIQQNIQFAEELTQSLMVQMIHTMSENGIDVSEKFFIRDMALTIELVKGSIYRDMKMGHISNPFVERFVDLTILDDDTIMTEVDFDTINELIDILNEDDDDPEVS